MSQHWGAFLRFLAEKTNAAWRKPRIDQCPVCLESASLGILPCGHGLCMTCVLSMIATIIPLRQSIPCPLCRCDIFMELRIIPQDCVTNCHAHGKGICSTCGRDVPAGMQCLIGVASFTCFECLQTGWKCDVNHCHSVQTTVRFGFDPIHPQFPFFAASPSPIHHADFFTEKTTFHEKFDFVQHGNTIAWGVFLSKYDEPS